MVKHGGKRENAGRKNIPSSERKKDTSIRLKNREWEYLHQMSETTTGKKSYGVGVSELIKFHMNT